MNDFGPIGPVIEIRRRGMLVATIPMEGERVSIGRSSSSHIRLEDNRVSRSHAAIERQPDGSVILIDLGSRAGTHLDGRRVTSYVPMPVSNHSKIGLIEYELVVRQPTSGQPFWPDFVQGEGEGDGFLILKVAAPVASHFPSRATSGPDDGSAAYRQLLEASRILGGGSDLAEQLEKALDWLLAQFPVAEGGIVLLPQPQGDLSPVACSPVHGRFDGYFTDKHRPG